MFLIKATKKTLKDIKKNKWLFLLLFITQLAFIIVFAAVQFKYQFAMAQDYKDILVSLDKTSFDESDPFTNTDFFQEIAPLVNAWDRMKNNFQYLLFFSFLLFISFNGLNWSLTHYLIKKQNILRPWGKFIIFSGLFFVPYIIIMYVLFKIPLLQENPLALSQAMVILAALFVYFALVYFAFVSQSFKKIFRKIFWEIGIKKFYWVLLVYLIITVILSLIIYLLYYSVNYWHIALVTLFILLLVLALSTLRIFLINSFSKIS